MKFKAYKCKNRFLELAKCSPIPGEKEPIKDAFLWDETVSLPLYVYDGNSSTWKYCPYVESRSNAMFMENTQAILHYR